MKKIIFLAILQIVSLLNSKVIMTLHELHRPIDLIIKENRMFITDQKTIHCYALGKKEYIRSIGRIGQGPGEFFEEPQIFVIDTNTVFVNSSFSGKVILFNLNGAVIEEKKVYPYCNHIEPIDNNYVVRKATFIMKESKFYNEIYLCDKNFNKIKKIFNFDNIDPVIEFPAMGYLPDFFVYNHNIFILKPKEEEFEGFIIDILDNNGTLKYRIEKNFKKKKVSQKVIAKKIEERKKISGKHWPIIKKSFFVPEYYPVVQDFMIQNHKIYIKTWFEKDDFIEFMILDLNGKELKKKYLPDTKTLYTFYGNEYYFIKENFENETWELHSIRLDL